MSVATGEVYVNPRCGEKVVIRTPAADTGGTRTIMDVYAQAGGAVSGEHLHPISEERFTLVRGTVSFLIGGRPVVLSEPGASVLIQPGIRHRWWNSGGHESYHLCEVRHNAARFEQLVLRQLFGLAQDGRTTPEGMPHLLQRALTTLEYQDVVRFTPPSWPVQRVVFGLLAPWARLLGLRACYPEYLSRRPSAVEELPDLPPEVAQWHALPSATSAPSALGAAPATATDLAGLAGTTADVRS